MEPLVYKPYEERTPDWQYHEMLQKMYDYASGKIETGLNGGRKVVPIHARLQSSDAENQNSIAFQLTGGELRYEISNGFPLLTERDLSFYMKGIFGELIGFMHGARTHEELSAFGCKFWLPWVTAEKCAPFGMPEHDLGYGSYGHSWARRPKAGATVSEMTKILFWRFLGESLGLPVNRARYEINQIVSVIEKIKKMPYLRTHKVDPWNPEFVLTNEHNRRRVVVAPCHGEFMVHVYPDDGEIEIVHHQRSGDFPVGVQFNVAQYPFMGGMIAQVTGYRFTGYVHQFNDPHIYLGQMEAVEKLLSREPRAFPTLKINPDIKNILDFRPEDFELTDYHPHKELDGKPLRIWTPV